MAVRHGYGKIAGTDALVFAYDTGDTRNSYKGEPTENLITNPLPTSTTGFNRSGGTGTVTYDTIEKAIKWEQTAYSSWGTYFNFHPAFSGTLDTGSQYTFSLEYKSQNEFADSLMTHQVVQGNGQSAATTNTDITSDTYGEVNGWKQYKITFTPANSGVSSAYNRFITGNRGTDVLRMWFRNIQFEKKSHKTQFTAGTRSVSGSLFDLMGNTSIDLTNAGFNSNAQLDFDGTNTYIPKFTDSRFQFADTNLTYEVVVNFESNPDSYQTLIGLADTNDYIPRINLSKFRSGTGNNGNVGNVYMQLIDQNGSGTAAGDPDLSGADLVAGGYYHYVGVVSKPAGSSTYYIYLYRNGELVETTNSGRTTYDTTQGVQGSIGLAVGTQFGNTQSVLDGQLPVAKVYNRALTAAEVQSNYRHYKQRFNL